MYWPLKRFSSVLFLLNFSIIQFPSIKKTSIWSIFLRCHLCGSGIVSFYLIYGNLIFSFIKEKCLRVFPTTKISSVVKFTLHHFRCIKTSRDLRTNILQYVLTICTSKSILSSKFHLFIFFSSKMNSFPLTLKMCCRAWHRKCYMKNKCSSYTGVEKRDEIRKKPKEWTFFSWPKVEDGAAFFRSIFKTWKTSKLVNWKRSIFRNLQTASSK